MPHNFEGASQIIDAVSRRPAGPDLPGTVLACWKASGGWGIEPMSVLELVGWPETVYQGRWIRDCYGYYDGSTWVLAGDPRESSLAEHLGLPSVPVIDLVRWVRQRVLAWVDTTFPGRLHVDSLTGTGVPTWLELVAAMNPSYSNSELLIWIGCAHHRPVGASEDPHWWLEVPSDPTTCFDGRDAVRLEGLKPITGRKRENSGLLPWPDHSAADSVLDNYVERTSLAASRLDREGAAPDDPRRAAASAAEYLWWQLGTVENVVALAVGWAEVEDRQDGAPQLLADVLDRAVIEARNEAETLRGDVPPLPEDIDDRVGALDRALRAAQEREDEIARTRRMPAGAELDAYLARAFDVVMAAKSLSACVRFRDEIAPFH